MLLSLFDIWRTIDLATGMKVSSSHLGTGTGAIEFDFAFCLAAAMVLVQNRRMN